MTTGGPPGDPRLLAALARKSAPPGGAPSTSGRGAGGGTGGTTPPGSGPAVSTPPSGGGAAPTAAPATPTAKDPAKPAGPRFGKKADLMRWVFALVAAAGVIALWMLMIWHHSPHWHLSAKPASYHFGPTGLWITLLVIGIILVLGAIAVAIWEPKDKRATAVTVGVLALLFLVLPPFPVLNQLWLVALAVWVLAVYLAVQAARRFVDRKPWSLTLAIVSAVLVMVPFGSHAAFGGEPAVQKANAPVTMDVAHQPDKVGSGCAGANSNPVDCKHAAQKATEQYADELQTAANKSCNIKPTAVTVTDNELACALAVFGQNPDLDRSLGLFKEFYAGLGEDNTPKATFFAKKYRIQL